MGLKGACTPALRRHCQRMLWKVCQGTGWLALPSRWPIGGVQGGQELEISGAVGLGSSQEILCQKDGGRSARDLRLHVCNR